jgi:hypothetical protein
LNFYGVSQRDCHLDRQGGGVVADRLASVEAFYVSLLVLGAVLVMSSAAYVVYRLVHGQA